MLKLFLPSARNFRLFYIFLGFSVLYDLLFYSIDLTSTFNSHTNYYDLFENTGIFTALVKIFNLNQFMQWSLISLLAISSLFLIFNRLLKLALPLLFVGLLFIIDANPLLAQFHDHIRLMTLFWFILFEYFPKQKNLILVCYIVSFTLLYVQPMALRDPAPWFVTMDGVQKTLATTIKHTVFSRAVLDLTNQFKILLPIAYLFEWIAPLIGIWMFGQKRKYALITLMLFHFVLNFSLNLMTFLPVMLANLLFLYPFKNEVTLFEWKNLKHGLSVFLVLITLSLPYRFTHSPLPNWLYLSLAPIGQDTQWDMFSEYLQDFTIVLELENNQERIPYQLSAWRDWRWATRFIIGDYQEQSDEIDTITGTLKSFCLRVVAEKIHAKTFRNGEFIKKYEIECLKIRNQPL
jgi:hypothetical protein